METGMTSIDAGPAVKALWWLVLIRGVLAVVFGLYALFQPAAALLALVFVYGFYAIMDGVAALAVGFRHRRTSHWGWHVVQGVVSLLAGVIALFWPGPTIFALVLIIGVWSIVLGATEIVEAFTARRHGSSSWVWLLVGGIVGVIFGVTLIASPAAGALTLLWVIGLFSLVFGVVYVVWAFQLRRASKAISTL
jgi:uncharacterized membrane protein HdeD (DUF308 family)